MFSNRSPGTLMSYTDHSAQRRFKSNAPLVLCLVYAKSSLFDSSQCIPSQVCSSQVKSFGLRLVFI